MVSFIIFIHHPLPLPPGDQFLVSEESEEKLRGTPLVLVASAPSANRRIYGEAAPSLEAYVGRRMRECLAALETAKEAAILNRNGPLSGGTPDDDPPPILPATNRTEEEPSPRAPVISDPLLAGMVGAFAASILSPLACVALVWAFCRFRLLRGARGGGEPDLEMGEAGNRSSSSSSRNNNNNNNNPRKEFPPEEEEEEGQRRHALTFNFPVVSA